jgi:hypothetical protein
MNEHTNQSFNVDDIRRLREENDLRYRDMTPAEISQDIQERATEGHAIIEQIRKEKAAQQGA